MSPGDASGLPTPTGPPAARGAWEDGTRPPVDQDSTSWTACATSPYPGRWGDRQAIFDKVAASMAASRASPASPASPTSPSPAATLPAPQGTVPTAASSAAIPTPSCTSPTAAPTAANPAPPGTQTPSPSSFGLIRAQDTEPLTVDVPRLLSKAVSGESMACPRILHFTRDRGPAMSRN